MQSSTLTSSKRALESPKKGATPNMVGPKHYAIVVTTYSDSQPVSANAKATAKYYLSHLNIT
jgi:hypothetical protein